MIVRLVIITLLLGLAAISALSQESYKEPTSIHLDWDLRSQPVARGRERIGLYSGSLRFKTGLAPGWNLELYGDRKDRSLLALNSSSDFVVQQATFEKEWKSQRLQLGLIRLPFGIYDNRETYASGLIDYPMPRVDYG